MVTRQYVELGKATKARTISSMVDSTQKLLHRIALVSPDPVFLNGKKLMNPSHTVCVTPSLLRDFVCTPGCTACCQGFTLDFTPQEFWHTRPWDTDKLPIDIMEFFQTRHININNFEYPILTAKQYEHDHCPMLVPVESRGGNLGCSMWPMPPLECEAAPNLLMTNRGEGVSMIMKKPFGRGWAWKETPQCQFNPPENPMKVDLTQEIKLLRRYQHWADYMKIPTVIDKIVEVMGDLPQRIHQNNGASIRIKMT